MNKLKKLRREEVKSLEAPLRDEKLAKLTMSKLDDLQRRVKSSDEFNEKLRHEILDFYSFLLNEKIMMLCDYVFFTKINDQWQAVVYDTGMVFPSDILNYKFKAGGVSNKLASGGAFGRYVYELGVTPDISTDSVGVVFSIKIGPKTDESEDDKKGGIDVIPAIDFSKVPMYDFEDALDRQLWANRTFTGGEAADAFLEWIGFDYMKYLNNGFDFLRYKFRMKFKQPDFDPIEDEPTPEATTGDEEQTGENQPTEDIEVNSYYTLEGLSVQQILDEIASGESSQSDDSSGDSSSDNENTYHFRFPFGKMGGRLPGII